MQIDVSFPARGDILRTDHHYSLYGALSALVPTFHDPNGSIRYATIGGESAGKGLIRLHARSCLRVRLPADQIALVLGLAGKEIVVGEHRVQVGVPTVKQLTPAPLLAAKVVTFKNATTPERCLEMARSRLDELGIQAKAGIPLIQKGERAGEPRRQVLRIKDKRVVGFALHVLGLTAEESVRLQETMSFCGRSRLGCGFFVPYQPREP
jgi:CRISPR-associated protein Cas6